MSEILTNYSVGNTNYIPPKENNTVTAPRTASTISADEFWRREKRKNNGLIERLYNGIKNLTGLGTGSKKIDKSLEELKQGKITQQAYAHKIKNYSSSQETSAQLFGDGASIAAAGLTFFPLIKFAKTLNAKTHLNEEAAFAKAKFILPEKWAKNVVELCKSNKKSMIAVTGLSALTAGWAKYLTLKLNRTGSDEFKLDEQVYGKKAQRNEYQQYVAKEKKRGLKKERMMTNFKNFASGMINGLMMPVMTLGGLIGTPVYLIGNSLNRYFVANKTDKNKTLNSYINNLTNDGVTVALAAAAAAIPLAKKGNYTKVLNQNIKKVTEQLQKASWQKPDYKNVSAFSELESAILGTDKIKNIIDSNKLSLEEQITMLTEENIFAVKFKQISGDSSSLTNALREKCPATRTIKDAQKYIDNQLGKGYEIKQLLGVGTIAETYLAKAPDGKEVCLKVVKEGISAEKIMKDKEKFVEIVKNLPNKSEEEKKYLLRNIDDLADGILKEVDFKNELEAAKALVPHTKVANVVKPIDVKNGVYIMEKAEGISLASLVDLNEAKLYKEALEKKSFMEHELKPKKGTKLYYELEGKKTKQEKIDAVNEYIKRVESRTPQFGEINLSKEDINYLVKEYMKVLVEQFNKVEKNGKVLHADIHPGNIFIDVNAMKSRKGKIFTLIDTGNTIKQTAEQSMRAINLTSYVERGNVPDLTEYVLDGAILPKNMTHEEAVKKVSEELNKAFFDNKTMLGEMNNNSILTLTSNIMRKYDIIPSDTQLNLNKARQSAANSLESLMNSLLKLRFMNVKNVQTFTKELSGMFKDVFVWKRQYDGYKSIQEKLNLKELPLAEQIKHKNNPNLLATNSEEYLTYKLKQGLGNKMPDIPEI